jgi:hypothetical protein
MVNLQLLIASAFWHVPPTAVGCASGSIGAGASFLLPLFGKSFVRVGCVFSHVTSLAMARLSSLAVLPRYLSLACRCFRATAS